MGWSVLAYTYRLGEILKESAVKFTEGAEPEAQQVRIVQYVHVFKFLYVCACTPSTYIHIHSHPSSLHVLAHQYTPSVYVTSQLPSGM
jgi:hypothetical protein